MTQKENDRMSFSLRECKDRKKGQPITMMRRNIFAVRLLARGHLTPGPSPWGDGGLTLGRPPGWVWVVGGEGALQGEEQEEDHESQANLRFQRVFD